MNSVSVKSSGFDVEKLLAIIECISDGVLAIDKNLNITFFNKAAQQILGVEGKNALGRKCYDIFRTDVCGENCPLRQTIKTGEPTINRFICATNAEGQRFPISVSTALLKDGRGRTVGGVETFRDLSQVEALHKALEKSYTFADMIGRDQKMKELFDLLPTISRSDTTVLIEGESGTGKELVARALHSLSPRSAKPMITVNCAAIPEALLESELFGYKAGAFTDAKVDKRGRFALAEGGTLFLDEIGDLSPSLQVKILRFLQEKTYEPLGSTQSEVADVRIISATNRDLAELMEEGKFRQDLYYRINVIKIKIPPLRERMGDLPLLINHFINRFNYIQNKDISGVTPPAMKILMKHRFPGNVRELEHIIEHAFVLCPGGVIKPEHLPDYLQSAPPIPAVEIAGTFQEMEALFLIAALKRNRWNRGDTARELGIDPSTLYRKIRRLGISVPYSDRRRKPPQ
jgi:PAS domain S-box-containing protein